MNEQWKSITVTKVTLAMRVPAIGGRSVHIDRPAHGIILNDPIASKDYVFSDGRVLHTEGNEIFYLPKGSTYRVKTYEGGDCYAINFDAELSDEPFVMPLRDADGVRRLFQAPARIWRSGLPTRTTVAMHSLYGIVLAMISEQERKYQPSSVAARLLPAVEAIKMRFSDSSLSVSELARLCDMSEVYFRKLFTSQFGVSPKEYLIRIRMEYAKQLFCEERLPVAKVAELCGYIEPCHFSREFTKRFGVSPAGYVSSC